ncbi:MAG TPA: NAD(P)-dependent oxidoreductase, partial [candidate division Zixibacteria bacterium]|nr:NAD(P)-dependent oxidoreductase [candidate division Zixibacteria bacterium]
MSNVLITGASGFIGHNLAGDMSADHTVVCLSRAPTEVAGVHGIEGDFTEPDDLCSLDGHPLDVIIHLGAVTGGCTEESGLRVNVSGAHHVLRYGIG